jgi:acyl-CoA reductase-like NAD-dependent aldehyde dehydrogenase
MPHWKASDTWWCIENTAGHGTPHALRPLPGEIIVHKTFFSAFSSESLEAALAAIAPSDLVLAGIHLHGCVRATALDAYQRSLQTWIAHDATGSNDPVHAAITRRYLEARGSRFATVDSLSRRFSTLGISAADVELNRKSTLLRSPANPSKVWEVPISDATEISRSVECARRAQPAIRAMPVDERAAAILRLTQGLEENSDSLVYTMAAEIGKPVMSAKQEIESTCQMLRKITFRVEYEERNGVSNKRFRHRPVGNIAVISSWNNPVFIPLGKIAPALLYGNTVVWKPAEAGTETAAIVYQLLVEVFPSDAVKMITGNGKSGGELINSPGIDAVSFTGSLNTGRAVQEACARKLIPLQAELGGNNAAIVVDDCDVELAAKEVARGAFAQAGQRCTATRRAIVMRPVLAEFIDRLKSACSAMTWGDPANESVEIGPLISLGHKMRVERTIERALGQGCRIEHCKPMPQFDDGAPGHCYFPPTILRCDLPAHEIVQEELFAPVLVVQCADSFDQAIHLCNNVKQGLAASVFTSSTKCASRFLDEVDAGILKINQATDGAEPDVPFGGWKASGIGPAEHGASDREFYTRVQAIYR